MHTHTHTHTHICALHIHNFKARMPAMYIVSNRRDVWKAKQCGHSCLEDVNVILSTTVYTTRTEIDEIRAGK